MMRKKFFAKFTGLLVLACVLFVWHSTAAIAEPLDDDAFIELCKTGTAQEVQGAIEAGANVNAAADSDWRTPLMQAAAFNENPEVITTLVNAGADVGEIDRYGRTALIWAAKTNSNPEVITALLRNGAFVNERDLSGKTVLMWAGLNRNPEVINVLLENGANVTAKNVNGMAALMWAAIFNENPEVIAALVKHGADVNAGHRYGITPLMWAAWLNPSPEIVTALLEHGADASIKDNDGQMAIDFARHNRHLANTAAFQKLYDLSQPPQN